MHKQIKDGVGPAGRKRRVWQWWRQLLTGRLVCLLLVTAMGMRAAPMMASLPPAGAETVPLEAESAVLLEAQSGQVLYQKEPHLRLPPASVTKVMTLLLTMEALAQGKVKLTDKIRTSEYAASMGGSQVWLEPGEEMTLDDMLKAIAVVSANDASVAVAEHLAGSVPAFVRKMNERARALGLKDTYFANPTGLPPAEGEEGTYSSAADIAVMARELVKYPQILNYTRIWMGNLSARPEPALVNTNKLVHFYRGCDGLKTGYTTESKYCLAATAARDGIRLIAVVMKAPSAKVRNAEVAKLFDYGFSQLVAHKLASKGQEVGVAKVARGKEVTVKVKAAADLVAVLRREAEGKVETKLELKEGITAPLAAGEELGKLRALHEGKPVGEVPVVAAREIERANILVLFFRFLANFWRALF